PWRLARFAPAYPGRPVQYREPDQAFVALPGTDDDKYMIVRAGSAAKHCAGRAARLRLSTTHSGPTGFASARDKPAIREYGYYSEGTGVLAQSTALRCRNPSSRHSGNTPSPSEPRRDWAEE